MVRFTLFLSLFVGFIPIAFFVSYSYSHLLALSYSPGYFLPHWYSITRTIPSLNTPKPVPLGFSLSRPSSSAVPLLDLVSLALLLVEPRPILLAYCLSCPKSLPAFCFPFFSRLIFSVSSLTSPEFLDLSYPW